MPEVAADPLLLAVLLQPDRAARLDPLQWDLLVRQARTSNLLARLADLLLDDPGRAAAVPDQVRAHLESALCIARRQQQSSQWELTCIAQALHAASDRVVVLKGAAYVALGLPLAATRLFGDVDILVPAHDLAAVETALRIKGWAPGPMSDYDQRYYRRWMHELPPMHHRRRGTTIDVHHTVLPRTARIRLDTAVLFRGLVPLPAHPGLQVLPPATMVLHSATHLFHEGEFGNGLRDLFDLDALLRHFGTDARFWPTLVATAGDLGVGRPLYYALTLTGRLLGTPVPAEALAAAAAWAPPAAQARLMAWLFRQALAPVHDSCATPSRRLAWFLLYLRSHWLRMPLPMLALHLARKAWRRFSGQEAREAERQQRAADPA